MTSNFTTTGLIERAGSEVVLMHTTEKYFEYEMRMVGCGISKVHFLGELGDWETIRSKVKRFKKVL